MPVVPDFILSSYDFFMQLPNSQITVSTQLSVFSGRVEIILNGKLRFHTQIHVQFNLVLLCPLRPDSVLSLLSSIVVPNCNMILYVFT